ncbi:MAG: glycerol-3-phosphate 1-O-acyltransferase PlsY [Betaproteobacteria bacterium]|nr:glycerol-3-phosphate 1-O-acyltransferase PlsY [Betaproteobacteria bacterium]
MQAVVSILLAYMVGSLSFAVIMSRLFRLPDPRTFGSHNPGATNVLRTGRKLAAGLTLAGDGLKGYAAVFLARQLGAGEGVLGLVALAVFLGHLYPLFFGFRGGKGVATALGILTALSPWLGVAVLASWLLAAYMWRISSLSALIAAALAPLYAAAILGFNFLTLTVLVLSAWLVMRHKANIRNLLAGAEAAIGSEGPQTK